MKSSILLIFVTLVVAIWPVFAKGRGHSYSMRPRSGSSEHFAKEVHQIRGGRLVIIRPRRAKALRFYSKH